MIISEKKCFTIQKKSIPNQFNWRPARSLDIVYVLSRYKYHNNFIMASGQWINVEYYDISSLANPAPLREIYSLCLA
jgi:hypothetical protein